MPNPTGDFHFTPPPNADEYTGAELLAEYSYQEEQYANWYWGFSDADTDSL